MNENLKELLKELGYPTDIELEDIVEKLRSESRLISKKLQVIDEPEEESELRKRLDKVEQANEIAIELKNQEKKAATNIREISGLVDVSLLEEFEDANEAFNNSKDESIHKPFAWYLEKNDQWKRAAEDNDREMMQGIYSELYEELKKGSGNAWRVFGYMTRNMYTDDVAYCKMVRYFTKAIEAGEMKGYWDLYKIYSSREEHNEAADALRKAVKENIYEAMFEYAEISRVGLQEKGFYQDYNLAYELYSKLLKEHKDNLIKKDRYEKCVVYEAYCYWKINTDKDNIGLIRSKLENIFNSSNKGIANMAISVYASALRDVGMYHEVIDFCVEHNLEERVDIVINVLDNLHNQDVQKVENMLLKIAKDESKDGAARVRILSKLYARCVEKEPLKAYLYLEQCSIIEKMENKEKLNLLDKYIHSSSIEAFVFFKEAVEMGITEANLYLGDKYAYGKGCKKDLDKALECYYRADFCWNKDYVEERLIKLKKLKGENEMYAVAMELLDSPDFQQGFNKLYELSAKGVPEATYALAEACEHGRKCVQDEKEACALYERAAEQGSISAMSRLVEIYSKGQLGQTKDLRRANHWKEKIGA